VATLVTVLPASRRPPAGRQCRRPAASSQASTQGVGRNQARLIIRGQRGPRVLFLEDGLRLNARRQTHRRDHGLIDSQRVDRQWWGPLGVYGSDAIGGVLNLRPAEHLPGKTFTGQVEDVMAPPDSARRGLIELRTGVSLAFGASEQRSDLRRPGGNFGAIRLRDSARSKTAGRRRQPVGQLRRAAHRQPVAAASRPALPGGGDRLRLRRSSRLRRRHLDLDPHPLPVPGLRSLRLSYDGSALDLPVADTVGAKPTGSPTNVPCQRHRLDIGPLGPGFRTLRWRSTRSTTPTSRPGACGSRRSRRWGAITS
jgi:hypothetical protein